MKCPEDYTWKELQAMGRQCSNCCYAHRPEVSCERCQAMVRELHRRLDIGAYEGPDHKATIHLDFEPLSLSHPDEPPYPRSDYKNYIVADANHLPFKTNTFYVTHSSQCVITLTFDRALQEMIRVTKNYGTMRLQVLWPDVPRVLKGLEKFKIRKFEPIGGYEPAEYTYAQIVAKKDLHSFYSEMEYVDFNLLKKALPANKDTVDEGILLHCQIINQCFRYMSTFQSCEGHDGYAWLDVLAPRSIAPLLAKWSKFSEFTAYERTSYWEVPNPFGICNWQGRGTIEFAEILTELWGVIPNDLMTFRLLWEDPERYHNQAAMILLDIYRWLVFSRYLVGGAMIWHSLMIPEQRLFCSSNSDKIGEPIDRNIREAVTALNRLERCFTHGSCEGAGYELCYANLQHPEKNFCIGRIDNVEGHCHQDGNDGPYIDFVMHRDHLPLVREFAEASGLDLSVMSIDDWPEYWPKRIEVLKDHWKFDSPDELVYCFMTSLHDLSLWEEQERFRRFAYLLGRR